MAVRRALSVLLLTLAGLIGLDASPAAAETAYTVTTTSDLVNAGDGVLSLREAITLANGDADDSRITLLPAQVHSLNRCGIGGPEETANDSGDLNVADDTGDLTIVGGGATIDQLCSGERVLRFAGDDLRVEATTITGGSMDITQSTSGGGIVSVGDSLVTLQGSVVSGNSAASGGGLDGNRFVLEDSLITGNTAAVGGAIRIDANSQSLTATDTSIVGNTANNIGGVNFTGAGVASFTNVTIGGNTANFPNFSVGSELNLAGGNATMVHTTIVGSANGVAVDVGGTLTAFGTVIDQGAGNNDCSLDGTTVSQGFNVARGGNCDFNGPTDHQGVADVGLGPLANNGGAGPTFLPDDGGLLDGMIPPASCRPAVPTDARGQARPTGAGCEPGAVERPPGFAADGQVRNANQATFVGNDVINLTGAGQTRSQSRAVGQKATFFARVQNDGDTLGGFRVRGPAGTNRFFVRYFLGTTAQNITGAVTAGTQQLTGVAPGATRLVRIEVTPRAAAPQGATIGVPVRFTALDDTTKRDVVKATVRRT